MTALAAIRYLESVGVEIDAAPYRYRGRFEFYAPAAGQMLTRDQLVEFANNERDLRS